METVEFSNCQFRGETGVAVRPRDGFTIRNSQFDCQTSVKLYRRHDWPWDITLDHLTHTGRPVWIEPIDWKRLADPPEPSNALDPVRILLKEEGNRNYRLHLPEQSANVVCPPSAGVLIGSPSPGLTNDKLQSRFGISTLGYVAPNFSSSSVRYGYGAFAVPTNETELSPQPVVVGNARRSRSGATANFTFTMSRACRPLMALVIADGKTKYWIKLTGPLSSTHTISIPNSPQRTQAFIYLKSADGVIGRLNTGTAPALK
jgi:hypothetical protein